MDRVAKQWKSEAVLIDFDTLRFENIERNFSEMFAFQVKETKWPTCLLSQVFKMQTTRLGETRKSIKVIYKARFVDLK